MAYRERQKISQMTPKGSNLAATDLIEISELVSGTYQTKSITGQEIIDGVTPDLSGYVPYVGATQDVDLDANKLSAESIYIEGTNGNGHLHLKHQNADATATGQSTALWANTDGDIKWKNDGNYKTTLKTSANTADRIYTFPNLDCTLVPDSRTITINGTTQNLSSNITFTISTGITVGTTPVTSGTDTRVFFQQGGVVQQDANFTFNNTQKRLTLRASGTAGTDIPFVVRNSADTFNLLSIDGVGLISGRTDGAGGFNMNYQGTANTTVQLGFQNTNPYLRVANSNAGGHAFNVYTSSDNREYLAGLIGKATLAIGANPFGGTIKPNDANTNTLYIFNGTAPTLSATDSFNLYSADRGGVAGKASAHFRAEDGTINVIGDLSGFGTSAPGARLDVRAQGALSTDIAFRVRNSADSVTLQQFNGDGSWLHRNNANTWYEYFDGSSKIEYRRTGIFELGTNNDVTEFRFTCNTGNVYFRGGSNILNIINNNNFHFEESTGILPTSGAGAIVLKNRTAPSTNVQDRFYLYSADIVAGNAAPHFRTEAGDIIKLYRETTAVAAATRVGGAGTNVTDTDTFDGYTISQVVKALRNLGILA